MPTETPNPGSDQAIEQGCIFAKRDLTRPGGMYAHLVDAMCAGCGCPIHDDAGCYADYTRIWHSRCWTLTRAQTGSATANPAGSPKVRDVQPEGDDR